MTLNNLAYSNSSESDNNFRKEGRTTISFYRYVRIDNIGEVREQLFKLCNALNCLGRIYLSDEGINAQMSIPENNLDNFLVQLNSIEYFSDIPIKYAVEDTEISFIKLIVKIRARIVADGLENEPYDFTNVGKHLSALEFHELLDKPDVLLIDMRNHYESEIGHFRGAILPQTDTFRETIKVVAEELKTQSDKKVLLYCTGGIRCEKASAYLKHVGFKDVNQLHGGIIEYAGQMKQNKWESKFIGKNFVFDERMGERVTEQIISTCYQCGKSCDSHTNCANNLCHMLFLQCEDCSKEFSGCCSNICRDAINDNAQRYQIDLFPKSKDSKYRKGIKRTDLVLIKSHL